MTWQEPRIVDQWYWMAIEVWDGERILRAGNVSWQRATGGPYKVSITYENERGLGLYCWPAFRALSDAQDFVEKLMGMASAEAMKIHGTEWPNVVI